MRSATFHERDVPRYDREPSGVHRLVPVEDELGVPRYVERIVHHVLTRLDEPLSLEDLAAVAGTSGRTVQNRFRSHYGCTPMEFLRLQRLERARHRLSTSPRATVTVVALECGFTHVGRFSLAYRKQFGESPSQTLRRGRAPDARHARGRS